MSILPIPAEMYFKDFAMSLTEVTIKRDGNVLTSVQGIENSEKGERYTHLPITVDVQVGDTITIDSKDYVVSKIAYDTYNGERQLIKVYY